MMMDQRKILASCNPLWIRTTTTTQHSDTLLVPPLWHSDKIIPLCECFHSAKYLKGCKFSQAESSCYSMKLKFV